MITREIVAQTIEFLEYGLDACAADDTQKAAEAQSLLNFWRLYLDFIPEAAHGNNS